MRSSNPLDIRSYRYKVDIDNKEPLLGNPTVNGQHLTSTTDGVRSWSTIDVGVTSVNTRTGDVTLDSTDVDLGNVDNTADTDKPISTDTQNALDDKLSKNGYTGSVTVVTSVDFSAQTTTTKTITYTDGQITDVS